MLDNNKMSCTSVFSSGWRSPVLQKSESLPPAWNFLSGVFPCNVNLFPGIANYSRLQRALNDESARSSEIWILKIDSRTSLTLDLTLWSSERINTKNISNFIASLHQITPDGSEGEGTEDSFWGITHTGDHVVEEGEHKNRTKLVLAASKILTI